VQVLWLSCHKTIYEISSRRKQLAFDFVQRLGLKSEIPD